MNTGFITVTNELNDLASCQIGFSGKSSFDGYTVRENTEKDPDNCVIKQINVITNTSDKYITVNRLSSVYANGIAKDFYEKEVLIHLCHFAWQGEAQWVTKTPLEMGFILLRLTRYAAAGDRFPLSGAGLQSGITRLS